MSAEFVNRAPAEAMARRAVELAIVRNRQAADALDFLVYGDEGGRHANKCVHALAGREPCSREYDPLPYPEAAPAEPRMYEDTGIAALYDLPGGEAHAWQLAGWNLVRKPRAKSREEIGS